MVKAVIYSAINKETGQIQDSRVFVFDGEVISEDMAKVLIEDPAKRVLYPTDYFDVSLIKLKFLIKSFGALQEIYNSIFNNGVGEDSQELEPLVFSDSKYLN